LSASLAQLLLFFKEYRINWDGFRYETAVECNLSCRSLPANQIFNRENALTHRLSAQFVKAESVPHFNRLNCFKLYGNFSNCMEILATCLMRRMGLSLNQAPNKNRSELTKYPQLIVSTKCPVYS